jgi:hypothetical protein
MLRSVFVAVRGRLFASIAVPLVLLVTASTAHAGPKKCQRTIATESARFAEAQHKELQTCVKARRKAGNPPAGTLAACKADPAVAAKLAKHAARLTNAIDRDCGGSDNLCGGDLTNEVTPASIGWPAACPNFENGSCVNQIFDCNDITTCVRCISETAVDQIVTEDYETFLNEPPDSDENHCQVAITAAVRKFAYAKLSALHACWDKVLRGRSGYNAPCPSGDPTGETQAKIARAELRKVHTICRACGGGILDQTNDGICDKLGFDPQTQIGFGSACPTVQTPGGTDCGAIGTITTLQKYIDCIDCVTARRVECIDRSTVLGHTPYPGECNPGSTITLNGGAIGKNLEISTGGSLGHPAPAGNLTITLTSADSGSLLLSKSPTAAGSPSITVTVGAGSSTIPDFWVQALADSGSVNVSATANGYLAGSAMFTLQPSGFVTFTGNFTTTSYSDNTALGLYAAILNPMTLEYAGNQPVRGGLTVNVPVTSDTPSVGSIVASPAVFHGGDAYNSASVFDPQAPGIAVVSIGTPTGFSTPGNYQQLTATVSAPHISLAICPSYYCSPPPFAVGKDLQIPVYIYFEAAPPNPVTITVTSSDGSVVTLSTVATLAGGSSANIPGVTGSGSVASLSVQGRAVGTATLTAQAAGYTDGTGAVTVNPSGFVLLSPGDFTTTDFSGNTSLQLYAAMLDPATLAYTGNQAVRGGLTVSVDVMSDTPSAGTIAGSPAVFNPNETSNSSTAFAPQAPGSTVVSISTPSGFSTPSNYQQLTATVTAPHISLVSCPYYCSPPPFEVGKDLQIPVYVYLEAAPPSPVTITVTSSDGTVVTLSTDAALAGEDNASVAGVTGSGYVATVFVQGRALGSVTLTAQAAGYIDGTGLVTTNPSGFVLLSPGDFTTTSFSGDTTLQVYAAMLDPTSLAYAANQPVRGGLTVSVDVMSDTPSVGTITGNPAVFNPGDSQNSGTAFDPQATGTAVVSIDTPAGFSTPSNLQQITATVTAAHLSLVTCPYYCYGPPFAVGRNLQIPVFVYLDAAPPNPITITVTSSDGTVVTLSSDATLAGGSSVSFSGVTGSGYVATAYIQGRSLGSATLTAQAAGYTDSTGAVTVNPAGFALLSPGDFGTTAYSGNTGLGVYPAMLDPTTLNYAANQSVRGGLTVSVDVMSDTPSVGTITGSPAEFNPGDLYNGSTAFDPQGPGTAVIRLGTPTGFSTPSNYQEITATVTAAHISLSFCPYYCYGSNFRVGRNLQGPVNVYLDAPPPSPITITLTSDDGTLATLSSNGTLAGGASASLTGVSTSGYVGTLFLQGRGLGDTTVTAQATGYADTTDAVTIDPAGFVTNQGDFTTSTSAADTTIGVYSARLDPITLNFAEFQQVRGGPSVDVTVSSADSGVGTIINNPATFNGGDAYGYTTFHPVAPGMCVVSIGVPVDFSMPSNTREFTVTVTP